MKLLAWMRNAANEIFAPPSTTGMVAMIESKARAEEELIRISRQEGARIALDLLLFKASGSQRPAEFDAEDVAAIRRIVDDPETFAMAMGRMKQERSRRALEEVTLLPGGIKK